jgi:hypothetical protein
MSYSPRTLTELGAYWTAHGGVNLGVVGDANHTTGYHLGRDRLPDGDYSARLPRDVAGLSGAASAIDLGKLNGSYTELYGFSRWLVASSRPDELIREIIYSPDGQRVQRWSGVDGKIHTGPGNGDASHRTHTHISYFRDTEYREKVAGFAGYWEDDMAAIVWYPTGNGDGRVILHPGRGLVDLITGKRYVPDDVEKESHTMITAEGVGDGYLVRDKGHGCLALADAVDFIPTLPGPSPAPEVLTGDDGSEYRRV